MPQTSSVCDGTPVWTPEQSCHEGCAILSKVRHIVIEKGICATVEWGLRHADGKTADLSLCFPTESSASVSVSGSVSESSVSDVVTEPLIKIRLGDCDGAGTIYEVTGTVADAKTGTIRFTLPKEIFNLAGIYIMDMAMVDATTKSPLFIDNGILSVETGLWGDTTQRTGPPTLSDIRIHLRDTPLENDLLDDVEFDVAEVINAIVYPVHQWNEEPPPVAPFTCRTFPYRFHWRQAVVGELLRISAHHYMRNNLKLNHGGLQGNVKDKYQEYLALAESYRLEWKEFIDKKKLEINAGLGMKTLGSPYHNTF